jgi:hypothetical protein
MLNSTHDNEVIANMIPTFIRFRNTLHQPAKILNLKS